MIHRPVRRSRIPRSRALSFVALIAMFTGLLVSEATPAAAATTNVNCPTDDLAVAITSAHSGDTLLISGTCHGNFIVNKRLTLSGMPNATLDGGGTGSTLTTNARRVTVKGLMITNGVNTVNGGGGGVYNLGGLKLLASTVVGNSAPAVGGAGGGILNNVDATLTLSGSTVAGNSADASGGAIRNDGTLIITNSSVFQNITNGSGGALFNYGVVTISRTTIRENAVSLFGGGIFNLGSVSISTSSLIGNTSGSNGGGIDNRGTLTLSTSTMSENSSDLGGAISNVGDTSTFTMRASTVSGNSASGDGGGIHNFTGTTTVDSSIVAGNSAPTGNDCTGGPLSNGFNLIGDADGCSYVAAVGDQTGSSSGSGVINPQLGPPGPNGGPTPTMALLAGSPAIDQIPVGALGANGVSALCPATGTKDQRGKARPRGGACDVGAFESRP